MQRCSRTASVALRVAQRSGLRVNAAKVPRATRHNVTHNHRKDKVKQQMMRHPQPTDLHGLTQEQLMAAFRFNPFRDIDEADHTVLAKAGREELMQKLDELLHKSIKSCTDSAIAQQAPKPDAPEVEGLTQEQVTQAFRFNPYRDVDDSAYHALWAKAGCAEKEFLETSATLAELFQKNAKDYADKCTDLVKAQLVQQLGSADLQGLTQEQAIQALSLDPCVDIDDAAYHALWENAGRAEKEFLGTSAKLAGIARLAGHHHQNFKNYAYKCSQARADLPQAQPLPMDFQSLTQEQVTQAFRFNPYRDIDDAAYHALWAKAGCAETEFLETSAKLTGLFQKNAKDYADMCTDLVKAQQMQQLGSADLQGLTQEQAIQALSLDPCVDIDDAAYHALWENAGRAEKEFLGTSAKLAGIARLAGHHHQNFKNYAYKCSQAVRDAGWQE